MADMRLDAWRVPIRQRREDNGYLQERSRHVVACHRNPVHPSISPNYPCIEAQSRPQCPPHK